jgi:multidrug efflux pump subunit AcrB
MKEQGMVIVQFYVGEDIERSLVKLYNEINKHMDQIPMGVTQPLIKTRAIDDVPILGLTLWSDTYDDYQLGQMALELENEIKKVNDVSSTQKIGGRNRQLRVVLDKDKLASGGLDFLSVAEMIKANNSQLKSGSFDKNDTEFLINTGKFLESVTDVENLVVGVQQDQPIYLKQVATIIDGPEVPLNYVSLGFGKGSEKNRNTNRNIRRLLSL